MSRPRPRHPAVAPTPDAVQSPERAQLRALLTALDDPTIAALLREIGHVLYNREILRWRVLTDVSDELLDRATAPARIRLLDRALAARNDHPVPPPPKPGA
jgi:hypothetical protein